MEEDWSIGENQTQEGTSKFIVLDSQEQVDEPQQDWPALQPPMAGSSEANNNQQPNKSRRLSLIGDLSEDERKLENAEVLVLDSEIEGTNFLHKRSLSNKGYRLPSDADEVISESEDQVNETILERPPKGDGKCTSEDDENQTEASGSKTIHSSTGSGSSFHSNSRQGLGSYQHAEMSHTGLQGHRFRMFQETLSQDIFLEDQEDNRESSTPSEFIGSLQLSNQPMLVPETVDEEENAIPPSPTAYGNVPMIIPSSPTAGKTTDSDIDDLDEHEFNPAAESTFADNPTTRHSQSSEESGLYHDSSSGKSEEQNVTIKKVSPRSLPSDEGNKDVQREKISTLVTDDVETCGESLHLHNSATESHSHQQREESVEVVEVEEKKEDSVIIISFDEGTDQGDVTQKSLEEEGSEGTQSQDLVLHLTPSQYSKSQASQRGSNSSQKQDFTHSPALDPLSQENDDMGVNPEKDKSNTSNSDSAGFHLSLPKDGTLLHPVEISSGQNKPLSQTSPGQNQPPSQTLSPHYPTPPPGPSHQATACETRPVPAPSLTMIDTQTSMSEPGFTLHRPEMREIPSEQTEDSRFEVFRQKKGTGKLTRSPSKRQIINDGSDDECIPIGSGNKRTREDTLSPRAESQQLPRLKKTRTLSSEATSTGYQASMEGMDTASPTEHMEIQEDVEDIMMQETESYDAGQTVQRMDVGETSEQHHTQIKTGGVDAVSKDRQPFQIVTGNTHGQNMEDSAITSPKPSNADMSIASEDLSHLERVKETIKHGHRRGKSKGKKSILKKRTEHDKEMTGISERQKETGLQDPYTFHGSQSQATSLTNTDTVPLVPEANVGQDQTKTSEQQPAPGSSKMETTPTTTRKKWNRAVHKKSGVKKAGPSQHVSFHNSVKNKSTPPRTETPKRTPETPKRTPETPKRTPKPQRRTSDSGTLDREVTRTPVAGQLAVRSPSVNPSTTIVTPVTAQATSIVEPTVSQSATMAPPPAVTPVRTTPICQDLVVGPLSMTTSDTTIPPLPQETVVTKTVYRMWLLECKEITQTFRSPDGHVTRQTTKKEEDPPKLLKEVTTETTELLSVSDLSPSPSRSTSTMTSGDLADVSSSISRSSSGSNRGSRQNLASLEGMGISQINIEKSATDMDTYFTPPEPVSAPARRTSAVEKPKEVKPNETTRRSSTQPSDFEISPHVGELSTINKTGSDVMETSHLTEEKRHSESLFTSSTEDCEKLAEDKEKTDEGEKAAGQPKDLGDISESSDGIPCGQTTVSIAVSSDGVENEAKHDVREPATSDTTSNDPHSSKRRKRSETSGSRSSEISPQISYQDPTLVRPDPALLCTPPTKGSAIKSETVIGKYSALVRPDPALLCTPPTKGSAIKSETVIGKYSALVRPDPALLCTPPTKGSAIKSETVIVRPDPALLCTPPTKGSAIKSETVIGKYTALVRPDPALLCTPPTKGSAIKSETVIGKYTALVRPDPALLCTPPTKGSAIKSETVIGKYTALVRPDPALLCTPPTKGSAIKSETVIVRPDPALLCTPPTKGSAIKSETVIGKYTALVRPDPALLCTPPTKGSAIKSETVIGKYSALVRPDPALLCTPPTKGSAIKSETVIGKYTALVRPDPALLCTPPTKGSAIKSETVIGKYTALVRPDPALLCTPPTKGSAIKSETVIVRPDPALLCTPPTKGSAIKSETVIGKYSALVRPDPALLCTPPTKGSAIKSETVIDLTPALLCTPPTKGSAIKSETVIGKYTALVRPDPALLCTPPTKGSAIKSETVIGKYTALVRPDPALLCTPPTKGSAIKSETVIGKYSALVRPDPALLCTPPTKGSAIKSETVIGKYTALVRPDPALLCTPPTKGSAIKSETVIGKYTALVRPDPALLCTPPTKGSAIKSETVIVRPDPALLCTPPTKGSAIKSETVIGKYTALVRPDPALLCTPPTKGSAIKSETVIGKYSALVRPDPALLCTPPTKGSAIKSETVIGKYSALVRPDPALLCTPPTKGSAIKSETVIGKYTALVRPDPALLCTPPTKGSAIKSETVIGKYTALVRPDPALLCTPPTKGSAIKSETVIVRPDPALLCTPPTKGSAIKSETVIGKYTALVRPDPALLCTPPTKGSAIKSETVIVRPDPALLCTPPTKGSAIKSETVIGKYTALVRPDPALLCTPPTKGSAIKSETVIGKYTALVRPDPALLCTPPTKGSAIKSETVIVRPDPALLCTPPTKGSAIKSETVIGKYTALVRPDPALLCTPPTKGSAIKSETLIGKYTALVRPDPALLCTPPTKGSAIKSETVIVRPDPALLCTPPTKGSAIKSETVIGKYSALVRPDPALLCTPPTKGSAIKSETVIGKYTALVRPDPALLCTPPTKGSAIKSETVIGKYTALVRPDPALLCTPPTKGSAIKSETVIGKYTALVRPDPALLCTPPTKGSAIKSETVIAPDPTLTPPPTKGSAIKSETVIGKYTALVRPDPALLCTPPTKGSAIKSETVIGKYTALVRPDPALLCTPPTKGSAIKSETVSLYILYIHCRTIVRSPPPTTPKTADISLDNLVDSKRRMSSRYEQQDLPNRKTRPSTSKPTIDAPTTSTSHSSSSVKRKRGGTVKANPVATSTPTPAKTASSRLRTAVVGLDTSPVGAAVSSPVTPRRSPRKARIGLFHRDRDARPQRKTTLFRGIVFLLTHVDRTKEQKEEEKKILEDSSLDVSTDESSSNVADEPTIPFDKNQLKVWIEDGGGIILEKYNEAEVSSARQCILLSDSYQRTVKYFQCLAAGLLCLSHVWVYDCYSEEELLDHKAYILPSGISLEKRRLMEWKPTLNLLVNMKVMVESESDKFKEEWTAIVRIAGGEAETKIQTRNQRVNVILSDKSCPNSVVRRAKQLNVPVVSTEWMIQCLINSQLMAYDGHPKYRYDYNQS
ncbi:uncharacterized protein [Argopecten irradians]|uniref:uncharacterized protein n=1 Tax=Argopecten irradians TaxID=31199 RepID=UPI0037159569